MNNRDHDMDQLRSECDKISINEHGSFFTASERRLWGKTSVLGNPTNYGVLSLYLFQRINDSDHLLVETRAYIWYRQNKMIPLYYKKAIKQKAAVVVSALDHNEQALVCACPTSYRV